MKRTLYIAIALLAAVSCTSTDYLDVEELDSLLVINAQMNTEEDIHTIHLSTSRRSSVKEVKGASVKVSINGGPFFNAEELDEQLGSSRKYLFYETLKAGDTVDIRASKDRLAASASFAVPQKPEITGSELQCDVPHSTSDTIFDFDDGPVYKPDEEAPYNLDAWHLLKVKIKDIPLEKSYYRITLGLENVMEDGGQTTISKHYISADFSSEPALTAGISSSADLVSALESSNEYNIFTDDLFSDKEYTLKIYISEYEFYYYRGLYTYYTDDGNGGEVTFTPSGEHTLYLTVQLHGISQGEYIYLRALGQDDLGLLFSEPVSIPSNVEGGLGYADASSSVEIKIPLETFVGSRGNGGYGDYGGY